MGAVAGRRLPGAGERPAQLPGLGESSRWDQISNNRSDWVSDRHENLQNRLENRGDFAQDWQDSRQDFMNDRREDWQNWADDRHPWHDDWHNGCWHGDWGDYWGHMWDEHPVWSAFAVTGWTLNTVAYGFGLWGYSNPYYDTGSTVVYDYSQPIVMYSEPVAETAAAAQPAGAEVATPLPPGVSPAVLTTFDQARAVFLQGQYKQALDLTDQAIQGMPGDAALHEFRALCLFALGQYREAAATLNAVLAVGPGWDWTTLVGLYPNVDVYTEQLRKLEEYLKAKPDAADARFVLAYQYMTMGHSDAAAAELAKVLASVPGDTVSKQLYDMLTYKSSGTPAPKPPAQPAPAGPKLAAEDLQGVWKASGPGGSSYELALTKEGGFQWTYTKGKKSQTLKGAFAVDGATIAMEPESGGVLIADLTPRDKNAFDFKMVGAKESDPVLSFKR
ncbi:MAG: tetratricopeptide repeat protein [Pirellulales bacterium]|nr:tetratricopeptide repeat protein [Pirellulales bacterium]